MALNLDPASIAEALRKNVESYTPEVSREEVGRVIESGDGIARVAGLPRTMANELLEFPGGPARHGLQPRRGRDRLHRLRRRRPDRGGRPGHADRPHPVDPRRRRVPRPRRRRPRRARSTARARSPSEDDAQPRGAGAERRRAPAGEGADVHGHHRDRRDDGDRARPAPADHRRPPDGEDRRRARHDHRPEAVLGHRPGREVHLRRDRSEGIDRGRGGRDASGRTARWSTRPS